MDDVIEVWDLRMNKKTRTIPWEGTGNQEEMIYEEEILNDADDEESKSNRPLSAITNQ